MEIKSILGGSGERDYNSISTVDHAANNADLRDINRVVDGGAVKVYAFEFELVYTQTMDDRRRGPEMTIR